MQVLVGSILHVTLLPVFLELKAKGILPLENQELLKSAFPGTLGRMQQEKQFLTNPAVIPDVQEFLKTRILSYRTTE